MCQVSAFPRPTQATHLLTRSDRGPTSKEWLLTNPMVIVFICAPLSRRAMQLSLLILMLTTFSIPYHQWKGSGFKKGVCLWHPMPWVSHPGTPLAWPPWLEGSGLPSLALSPPFGLNGWLFPSLALSPPFGLNGWLFWVPSPMGIHG